MSHEWSRQRDACACGTPKALAARQCRTCYLREYTGEARFWAGADRSGGPDACWPWQRGLNGVGYGQASVGNRSVTASRRAWELANGAVPDGLFVLHRCDNRPCINPRHLWLGTHTDNMRDMEAKGRGWHPKGEATSYARLTEAAVREIRRRYAAGGITQRALGREYGVCQTHIGGVVRGVRWGHVF